MRYLALNTHWIVLVLLLVPRSLWADSFDIHCDAIPPDSIQAAINQIGSLPLGAAAGPHGIHVFGECVESVNIAGLDRINIFTEPDDGGTI